MREDEVTGVAGLIMFEVIGEFFVTGVDGFAEVGEALFFFIHAFRIACIILIATYFRSGIREAWN